MYSKIYFYTIVLLYLLTFCSGCNRTSSAKEEVLFDDGYKTSTVGDEVIFDNVSFEGKKEFFGTTNKNSREITRIAKDGSQINVSYDGFGNKSEKRTFNNDPLLRMILLRTGVDGNRQVFVYGQNGEVKNLPENMLDKVLTAAPNELANSAGIYEGIKEQTSYEQNTQLPDSATLKPLPSSQFPIRNQQIEQTPPETEEPSGEIEKPQSVGNKKDDEPTAKSETQSNLNEMPNEEK